MTKVLIIGGAGRLGSAITRLLTEHGIDVKIFSRGTKFHQFIYFPKILRAHIETIKGDLTDYNSLKQAIGGIDGVFHLSALLPPASEVNRDKTMALNVGGTENLIKALTDFDLKIPIIFPSTVAVYGKTCDEISPISEEHPTIATDIYSESKITAENLIKESELPYVILRITAIAIPTPVEFPEVLPFKADQRVEFVYNEDVAKVFLAALENERALFQIFNVAGGETWRMIGKDYVKKLSEAMGINFRGNYSSECSYLDWYDTNKIRNILKFKPTLFEEFLKILHEESLRRGPIEPFVAT